MLTLYQASNELKRATLKQHLAQLDTDLGRSMNVGFRKLYIACRQIVPRGQQLYCDLAHKYFAPRISIIAAYSQGKLKAYTRFEGHTNIIVFDLRGGRCLVPVLRPRQIVILDNATFHKSPKMRKLIESAGCKLLF